MGLTTPRTVNDPRLLEDEPFKGCFEEQRARGDPLPPRGSSERPDLCVKVEEIIRKEPESLGAARAWLRTVFYKEPDSDLPSTDLDVFVQFYWIMFSRKEDTQRHLEHLLFRECKARKGGYQCALGTPVLVDPIKDPQPAAEAVKKARKPRHRKRPRDESVRPLKEDLDTITRPVQPIDPTGPSSFNVTFQPFHQSEIGHAGRGFERSPIVNSRKKPGRKRKAEKHPLESENSSSADESPQLDIAPNTTDSFQYREDSPLTSLSSEIDGESPARIDIQFIPLAPSAHAVETVSLSQGQTGQLDASPTQSIRKEPQRSAANRVGLHAHVSDCKKDEEGCKGNMGVSALHRQEDPTVTITGKPISSELDNDPPIRIDIQFAPPAPPVHALEAVPPCHAQTGQDACPPTGVRRQPPRLAANRDRLQALAVDRKKYEKNRRGNMGIPASHLEGPAPSNSGKTKALRGRSRARGTPRRKSNAVQPIPQMDTRPEKKKKGNNGEVVHNNDALTETVKTTIRIEVHPDAQPQPSPNSRGGVDAEESQGSKRPRDPPPQTVASDYSQTSKRPTKRMPRRKRKLLSYAPPRPVPPEGLQLVDDVLRDAGENGRETLRIQNEEEQASEWEQDPDSQLPDDSSESEPDLPRVQTKFTPKSRRGKLSRGEKVSEEPTGVPIRKRPGRPRKSLQVPPPTDISAGISVDYTEQTGAEMLLAEHELIGQEDPRLTPCPLIDDPLGLTEKAELLKLPPIWAESRQEVCESFDWFRSYQGGVYFAKDIVKGYLLSAFSANRDLFYRGGRLIISHGGGKAAQSLAKAPGTVVASDQQEDDKSVRALLHNYRTRRPLVLIIDDKYALFPFDLASKRCTYAILGWYQIAHAWAEYQPDPSSQSGRVIRYKFAFQWCEAQGAPWWDPPTDQVHIPPMPLLTQEDLKESVGQICDHCSQWSPQVYEEGWMCLKPRCRAFWHLRDVDEVPYGLQYSAAFLRPVQIETDQILGDLRPPLPASQGVPDKITTSRHFCKGWHCSKCGRLSSRFKWEHWECKSCGNIYAVPGRLRTANEFFGAPKGKFDTHRISPQSGILPSQHKMFRSDKAFGTHVTFVLPYGRGKIHTLLSRPTMNSLANEILRQYQDQAASGSLKFRRWPLRSHKCRGTLLTNYFSQNTGEPYQYVGGTANTVSFDSAPTAVVGALDLIKTRITQAGLGFDPNFNEVLTAAYMEEQKMAFHSDAERGLGPNVASLSLGAGAYMHFRLHAQFAGQEMPNAVNREVLTLFLRHGDVVVMEGADIQKYYEHTVVPLNFRIAATARFIGREHHAF